MSIDCNLVSGIASSKREEIFLSVGKILQGLVKGKFLCQLRDEWKGFKDKGKIKDDYQHTQQHQECLQEILDYLDNSLPNQITFDILKKIFLLASTESISDRESLLPQAYMRIIKKLSPEAILILISNYDLARKNFIDNLWIERIALVTKLNFTEIIEIYESELIKLKLLMDRIYKDKSGYYRLTQLGYEICQYIEKYEGEESQ